MLFPRITRLLGLLVLANLVCLSKAHGHSQGENYVWVNIGESHLEGRFEIHFQDLETKLNLDLGSEDATAAEAIKKTAPVVHRYLREHFSILSGGSELTLEFTKTDVHELQELGSFGQYYYTVDSGPVPDKLTIRNNLFFENDRFHRSLIAIEFNKKASEEYGAEFAAMVFSASNNEQELDLLNVHGLLNSRDFIWQGMLHIWGGIDHVLFLIALLLPAVLVRQDQTWKPVANFRAAFWNILKIITIFTLAHSITLSLAALDVVRLPSPLIESVIALSIILVALNAIYPWFREGVWVVIFFFGLFHGLGFATVFGHLPFRMENLVKILFSFNVGVEIGQIVIVACAFPLIYSLRGSKAYLPVVLKGGSFAICLVASYWFVERAFGL